MLASPRREWVEKARFWSQQARDPGIAYEHTELGYNYRMSNVLAGIGRGQLEVLDERVEQRRAVAFRRMAPRHVREYLGYAIWFHGGVRFPALQCIWADPEGRFPWDAWFPREARGLQPTLYEPDQA